VSGAARPSGTVTFLFSDIEGSTQRWERAPDAMAAALARHDALVRAAIEAHGGYVFKVMGDAFCAAFATTGDATASALDAQRALGAEDFSMVDGIRVRMALHAGPAEERAGDYAGQTLNRIARLLAIGHGGQVLVSGTAAELLHEAMPGGTSLRDLGQHRLKDLARAERVFQLIAPELLDAFPALRSLESLPNNLPQQLTSFVGREDSVAEIKELAREHHLVTLLGTGGVGKTRCAVQAGAELLERYEDGVWFVELAPISDASLVTVTIAQRLGVRQAPDRSLLETLLAHVERRQLLLILDNCEHVIETVREVAAALLRRAPGVRILGTSREPLNVAGERILRLPPLPAPAAVALFSDRALASDPGFVLTEENAPAVAEIARRLDGIPLALELAAARVRVLSPAQLARRLDERFRLLTGGDRSALPRQRTLQATIDWSYDLLDERERALFRRLSIFAGGWELRAAAAVAGEDGAADEWEVLDALSSLVDKSLVIAEPHGDDGRYRMLQSVREYGLERLAESGEADAIAGRHARYYAALARDVRPLALGLEDEQWWRRLTPEIDNLRAAIDWTIAGGHESNVGLSLLADLEWPELLTTPNEALGWYEAALRRAIPDRIVHAKLLRHCVMLEWLAGRPLAEREPVAVRAVEVARGSGDADEIARALANLGGTYRNAGRFDEADRALAEAYATPERLSRITTNTVLRIWAVTDLQRGDVELARRRFSEVVRLERAGSDAHSSALLNLGELEFATGNTEAARQAARHAKETYERLNSIYLILVLSNLAAYAMSAGDIEEARAHLREALRLHSRYGHAWLGHLIDNHALLAALLGDYERAALLAGFTDALHRSRGDVRQHTERRVHERLSEILAEIYAADERERRTGAGARLSDEEALAHAAAIHEATTSRAAAPPKGIG
jgi:predicted ATPase/class 3 adenylate cyclase/Flp pilus assembly protein TadD